MAVKTKFVRHGCRILPRKCLRASQRRELPGSRWHLTSPFHSPVLLYCPTLLTVWYMARLQSFGKGSGMPDWLQAENVTLPWKQQLFPSGSAGSGDSLKFRLCNGTPDLTFSCFPLFFSFIFQTLNNFLCFFYQFIIIIYYSVIYCSSSS